MKRLLALAVLIASAAPSAAQTSTAPIGVSAKVQSAVTLSGMVPLDFGTGIVPGTPATITPANGGKIMASYNVNTQLSLPNTVTLTRAGGGSVVVTLSCAQAATGTAPAPTPFATDCATGRRRFTGRTVSYRLVCLGHHGYLDFPNERPGAHDLVIRVA